MNKHEQLVHSSFPKPHTKATPAYKGSQSPVPSPGMLQPENTLPPMMNPQNPAEY